MEDKRNKHFSEYKDINKKLKKECHHIKINIKNI
jgi:hypothetical protein